MQNCHSLRWCLPGIDTTYVLLQFTSHRISAVEHRPDLAKSVHIVHIGRSDKAEAGKLLLTSSCEHKLKYKTSHGQLYGLSPDIESLCLKVLSATPSHPCMFEVVLPDGVRHPPLDGLNQSLADGSLQVEFRNWAASSRSKRLEEILIRLHMSLFARPSEVTEQMWFVYGPVHIRVKLESC